MDAITRELEEMEKLEHIMFPPVIVGPEPWSRLWPDCRELMMKHKEELSQNDPRAPLEPDHERIEQIQAAGGLLLLGARHGQKLVGYSIWYLMPSLETVGLVMAQQAPWYVKPEWRSVGVGLRLWKLALLQLKQRGVRLIHCHYPPEHPELGLLFARYEGKVVGTEVAIWLPEAGEG